MEVLERKLTSQIVTPPDYSHQCHSRNRFRFKYGQDHSLTNSFLELCVRESNDIMINFNVGKENVGKKCEEESLNKTDFFFFTKSEQIVVSFLL